MMALRLLISLTLLTLIGAVPVNGQGLFFNGSEKTIAERSALSVPPESENAPSVRRYGFETTIRNHNLNSPGFIFFLDNKEGKEAYTLSFRFDDWEEKGTFTLAKNGERNLFSTVFSKEEIQETQWPLSFSVDYDTGRLDFSIGGHATSLTLPEIRERNFVPQLNFGMTRNIVESASFSIRDLRISADGEERVLPLNESKGEDVHDSTGNVAGRISNPRWLINKAFNWEKILQIFSSTPSGVAFDAGRHILHSFNADTLRSYNLTARRCDTLLLTGDRLQPRLGMNIFDSRNGKIILYEIFHFATVGEIDPESGARKLSGDTELRTVWHHHAQAFRRKEGTILLFGGFGNRAYSNTLMSYDIDNRRWDSIPLSGDRIDPRFFTSMMLSASGDTLYIYGGKGNREGRQEVGIRYYYDLHEIDLRNRRVRKLWEQPAPDTDRVPGRFMIPSSDGRNFYVMAYAEYKPHTSLQLYRVNLATGEQIAVGDSIPMISEEIASNVALYEDAALERLYCVVQEYQKYGENLTTVYCISTPPVSAAELQQIENHHLPLFRRWWLWAIIGCVLLILTLLLFRKKRPTHNAIVTSDVTVGTRRGASTESGKSAASPKSPASTESSVDEPRSMNEPKEEADKEFILRDETNRIELFGPFRVTDRKGRDITYMFSPRLRNVFCYLLLNTLKGDGISSSSLTAAFWADKEPDKAKNLRNVTLNKLRKILAEMDGVELVYEQGLFRLVFANQAQCDISHLWQLSEGLHKTRPDGAASARLCEILLRGKFLAGNEDPVFDYCKSAVEEYSVAFLEQAIKESSGTHHHRGTRRLCRALLIADPLSETALETVIASYRKEGKREEALAFYQSFALEYKKLTGEDYPKPYSEL
jgi:DNA-binding SARP family transcriptional activator